MLINKNNVQDKVKIYENISENMKTSFFNKANVFVLPSLYEGLPATLLEAMAYGKAVVCSNLPSTRSVIKENYNGFLIDLKSDNVEKEFADKINFLLQNQVIVKKMGERNRELVKNFTWDKVSKRINTVYREITG
jgi:glycosyltransferase involved in cell wall biosynthesis